MYEIKQKREDINFVGNNSEVTIIDFTILNRLQLLSFELQSILYNFNLNCASTETKKAIYLETYVNYIGEIFNQSIISNQGCKKKDLEKEIVYNR